MPHQYLTSMSISSFLTWPSPVFHGTVLLLLFYFCLLDTSPVCLRWHFLMPIFPRNFLSGFFLTSHNPVVLNWGNLFYLQGVFGNTWRHFLLWQLRVCYWFQVGRSQGCCGSPYDAQDNPPTVKSYPAQNVLFHLHIENFQICVSRTELETCSPFLNWILISFESYRYLT